MVLDNLSIQTLERPKKRVYDCAYAAYQQANDRNARGTQSPRQLGKWPCRMKAGIPDNLERLLSLKNLKTMHLLKQRKPQKINMIISITGRLCGLQYYKHYTALNSELQVEEQEWFNNFIFNNTVMPYGKKLQWGILLNFPQLFGEHAKECLNRGI